MSASQSLKSQAEQIRFLQQNGWKEDQDSRDIRRWREPKTKALYSLRDAVSLLSYAGNGKKALTR